MSTFPFVSKEIVSETTPLAQSKFMMKVYGILSCQIVVTAVVVALTKSFHGMGYPMQNPSHDGISGEPTELGSTLFYTGIIGSLVSLGVLHSFKAYPTSLSVTFGWLGAFTIFEGLFIGVALSPVPKVLLLKAFWSTVALFSGLSYHALTSKTNFSFLRGFLFNCLLVLLFQSILSLIFGFSSGDFVIYFGLVVFCGYVLFDTWRLADKFSTDDYVLASIELYLDFVNIFIRIVRLLKNKK